VGESELKFKGEIGLLLMAIVLFVVSVFFYSYHATGEGLSFSASLGGYPYRGYAFRNISAFTSHKKNINK